jgi:hypothetical protein
VTLKLLEPILVTPDKVSFCSPGITSRQMKVSGTANFTVSSHQPWAKVEKKGQTIVVSADPSGQGIGPYRATLTVKDEENGPRSTFRLSCRFWRNNSHWPKRALPLAALVPGLRL